MTSGRPIAWTSVISEASCPSWRSASLYRIEAGKKYSSGRAKRSSRSIRSSCRTPNSTASSRRRLLPADRRVVDQRPRPEADAQDVAERHVEEQHARGAGRSGRPASRRRAETKAPPTIAVHRIPENDPWCSRTEFRAREKIIDHITDRQKPRRHEGAVGEPGRAEEGRRERDDGAAAAKPISTLRLSNSFSSTRPSRQPTVISPQNMRHRARALDLGIEAVVGLEELRDPVGDALLRADVAEDGQEIEAAPCGSRSSSRCVAHAPDPLVLRELDRGSRVDQPIRTTISAVTTAKTQYSETHGQRARDHARERARSRRRACAVPSRLTR